MKVVNMKVNNGGDDYAHNRLLSYLRKEVTQEIEEIVPLRNHVFLVKGEEFDFILKGFSSYHRLKLQETFTSSLYNVGFHQTYQFLQLTDDPPLYWNQVYYGCLSYIPPSEDSFTFKNRDDRKEGLELLKEYHHSTETFVTRYRTLIAKFKIMEKWQERTATFLTNLHLIKFFVQKEIINELLNWADWALKGMEEEKDFFVSGPSVILHGDVAHHNFLRNQLNQDLYLLDFDLISIGPTYSDYLQYSNRILPFMMWSFDELATYKELDPFLNERAFLYALAFPTDIFREWNRIIREKSYMDTYKIRQVLDLTVRQFSQRQNFVNELKERVN
ncbi:phosphotransferase [Cytobacillus spongiae]|jgi:hypothetical protein|uniref:phosphotransferase n=1 Tax=Cytobacillus spongiae TaxID=2901381 RepID=UPI001F2DD11D|nr:phosphotransferase [Cytobacillus spongiae]UII57965.1 phosphotransferase [Cytobacillus spongiae]